MADAGLIAAASAAIQPVALRPLLHRTPPQHWTAPGCTGLNAVRKIAPTGIAPLEAPGVFHTVPGPSLLGRDLKLKWEWFCAAEPRNPRPRKLGIGTSAAVGGRPRFDYVVDDLNNPKMSINRLPGHRL